MIREATDRRDQDVAMESQPDGKRVYVDHGRRIILEVDEPPRLTRELALALGDFAMSLRGETRPENARRAKKH